MEKNEMYPGMNRDASARDSFAKKLAFIKSTKKGCQHLSSDEVMLDLLQSIADNMRGLEEDLRELRNALEPIGR